MAYLQRLSRAKPAEAGGDSLLFSFNTYTFSKALGDKQGVKDVVRIIIAAGLQPYMYQSCKAEREVANIPETGLSLPQLPQPPDMYSSSIGAKLAQLLPVMVQLTKDGLERARTNFRYLRDPQRHADETRCLKERIALSRRKIVSAALCAIAQQDEEGGLETYSQCNSRVKQILVESPKCRRRLNNLLALERLRSVLQNWRVLQDDVLLRRLIGRPTLGRFGDPWNSGYSRDYLNSHYLHDATEECIQHISIKLYEKTAREVWWEKFHDAFGVPVVIEADELDQVPQVTESEVEEPVKTGSCLVHLWASDTQRGPEHCGIVDDNHVLFLNNVDYYLDERSLGKIATGNPIILRTLDIVSPVAHDAHRQYQFNLAGEIEYTVSVHINSQINERDEKHYVHKIWEWRAGSQVTIGRWSYNVHVRKPIGSDYKLVLLLPYYEQPETLSRQYLKLLGINPDMGPLIAEASKEPGLWSKMQQAVVARIPQRLRRTSQVPATPVITVAPSDCDFWSALKYTVKARLTRWYLWTKHDLTQPPVFLTGDLPSNYVWQVLRNTMEEKFWWGKDKIVLPPRPKRLDPIIRGTKNYWVVMHCLTPGVLPKISLTYKERLSTKDRDEQKEMDKSHHTLIAQGGSFTGTIYTHSVFTGVCQRNAKPLSPADLLSQFHLEDPLDRGFLQEFVADTRDMRIMDNVPTSILYDSGQRFGLAPTKPKGMYPLMNPLGDLLPVAAITSYNNGVQAIKERNNLLQSKPEDNFISEETHGFIDDFVSACYQHFVDKTGITKLHPLPIDQVIDRQATPAKRESIIASYLAINGPENRTNAIFVKRESDAKGDTGLGGQPRPIVPKERDPVKALYMSFIYSLKKLCIELPFIGSGLQVCEIEEKIREICQLAMGEDGFEGDLSRMDGNKWIVDRVVLDALFAKVFDGRECELVRRLHMLTIGMILKVRKTESHDEGDGTCTNGFGQASGMPDTSEGNGFANGFGLYKAKRLQGCTHAEAWAWMLTRCVVSGDDSFGCGLPKEFFDTSFKQSHHKPKFVLIPYNEKPFTFLGRMYGPDMRACACVINNVQDPARVLGRFTMCASPLFNQFDRRRRLFDKACAMLIGDPHSPHISLVARAIVRAGEDYGWTFEVDKIVSDLNYLLQQGGDPYSNTVADWQYVAYTKAHPNTDFGSMDQYFGALAEHGSAWSKLKLTGMDDYKDRPLWDMVEDCPRFSAVKRVKDDSKSLLVTNTLNHREIPKLVKLADRDPPDLDTLNTTAKQGKRFRKSAAVAMKSHQRFVTKRSISELEAEARAERAKQAQAREQRNSSSSNENSPAGTSGAAPVQTGGNHKSRRQASRAVKQQTYAQNNAVTVQARPTTPSGNMTRRVTPTASKKEPPKRGASLSRPRPSHVGGPSSLGLRNPGRAEPRD